MPHGYPLLELFQALLTERRRLGGPGCSGLEWPWNSPKEAGKHNWIKECWTCYLSHGPWCGSGAGNPYLEALVLNAAVPGSSPDRGNLCCMSSPALHFTSCLSTFK
ncbi:hypothetical protein CHARACLAT_024044 [Characodon lateralis]|uniref:Uncharacterized protein n=1 Tax=Characodon lateralis TaxID=208331 RepID=A0ABU7E6D9_9TELE|nr:hypothetical protein [Characodon lateralis]